MDLTSSPRKGAELEFESNSQLNPKSNSETKGWDTKAAVPGRSAKLLFPNFKGSELSHRHMMSVGK